MQSPAQRFPVPNGSDPGPMRSWHHQAERGEGDRAARWAGSAPLAFSGNAVDDGIDVILAALESGVRLIDTALASCRGPARKL